MGTYQISFLYKGAIFHFHNYERKDNLRSNENSNLQSFFDPNLRQSTSWSDSVRPRSLPLPLSLSQWMIHDDPYSNWSFTCCARSLFLAGLQHVLGPQHIGLGDPGISFELLGFEFQCFKIWVRTPFKTLPFCYSSPFQEKHLPTFRAVQARCGRSALEGKVQQLRHCAKHNQHLHESYQVLID